MLDCLHFNKRINKLKSANTFAKKLDEVFTICLFQILKHQIKNLDT